MKKLLFIFLFLTTQAGAVTRFYFSSTGIPTVSPPFTSTAWSYTEQAARRTMSTISTGSAMSSFTIGTQLSVAKDSLLYVIFVSDPIKSQLLTGTFKGQIRGLETANDDNATVAVACAVFSNNGDTLKAVLFNTKCSDGTTRPPELSATTLTNRQFQDQAEATSITLTDYTCNEGDRIGLYVGVRENTTTDGNALDLSIGDDAGSDLAEDNTTTTANNPWGEFSMDITFTGGDQPQQPPAGCQTMAGDTLYPYVDGDSTALGTDTLFSACGMHADCIDEAPDASGCGSANDSIWFSGNGNARDFFYLRTARADSTWGTFRGARTNDQIDCIAVTVCVRRNSTTRERYIQLGFMDSSSGSRRYWTGPEWTTLQNTARQTFTFYMWNKPSGTEVLGNSRWDSASLANLQVRLRVRAANAADFMYIYNAYVLVYASSRDTSVPDSTNSSMQYEAAIHTAAGTTSLTLNRQQGLLQSKTNKNRFWLGATTSGHNLMVSATNDTANDWYWLSGTADGADTDDWAATVGDTITLTATAQGLATSGLSLFDDYFATFDTLSIGTLEAGGLDTSLIYSTKRNQQVVGDLTAVTNTPAEPANGSVALVFPAYYKRGNEVWTVGGTATGSGRLRWRHSTDNGNTWRDTGYVQGQGETYTSAGTSTIQTTAADRRAFFIRWRGGWPALVTTGWSSIGYVRIQRWHPEFQDSGNLGAGRNWPESLRVYAFFRNPNTTTCDTINFKTVSSTTNNGEVCGTSYYAAGDTAAPVGMLAFVDGSRIRSCKLTVNGGGFSKDTFVVAEASQNRTSTFLPLLSIANFDTLFYVFFNLHKNNTSATDTQSIVFAKWCGNGWCGPRPVSFFNSTNVQSRSSAAAPYQWGPNRVVCAYTHYLRNTVAIRAASNQIIKPVDAAAGGTDDDKRRRRLIIERKHKFTEMENEEDIWPIIPVGTDMALSEER